MFNQEYTLKLSDYAETFNLKVNVIVIYDRKVIYLQNNKYVLHINNMNDCIIFDVVTYEYSEIYQKIIKYDNKISSNMLYKKLKEEFKYIINTYFKKEIRTKKLKSLC